MTHPATKGDVPVLTADPYAIENIIEPYAFGELLRETGSVVYLSEYDVYAVGRYAEVRTAIEDWKNFSSAAGLGLTPIDGPNPPRPRGILVESDPPEHTGIRATLQKILSPKMIRDWQDEFEAEANKLADGLLDRTDVDGVADISEAYVTTVFPKALGVKVPRENLIILGDYTFNQHGAQNELYQNAKKAFDAISGWYEEQQKRENLQPGGFGEQVYLAEDAGDLPPGGAASLVRTFLRAGMDTTISGIGSMLLYLSRNPHLWKVLRADRSRVKFAFEEAIRLETPASSWYRTTVGPVEIGGYTLPAKAKVHVFASAANRDPRKFANPASFDLDRGAIGHLALGRGVHLCIGQTIARKEAECLLNALLDRFEEIEPRADATVRPINNLRTWATMPLLLKAA
jgi:cytochrome P450